MADGWPARQNPERKNADPCCRQANVRRLLCGGSRQALHVGVPYAAGQQFSVVDITLLVTIGFAAKAIDLALPGEHLAKRCWYHRVSRRSSTSAGAGSTAVIRPMAFRPLKRLTASRR